MAYKKDILFRIWKANPSSDKHNRYKQFPKKATKWVKGSKKEHTFKKLGEFLLLKLLTKPLRYLTNSNRQAQTYPF